MDINREELAWAAGLFDGEGHSSLAFRQRKSTKYASILVDVSQRDRRVLDRFQVAVNGIGHVYGPYTNGMHSYRVNNFEGVQAVIAMIYQFLSPVKQQQCLNTLKQYHEWWPTIKHKSGRPLKYK